MINSGFAGLTDETLGDEWKRSEAIFRQQCDRVNWLKRAIESSYNTPEQAAWHAALEDATEQCEATQEWLYSLENELYERFAKGWAST